MISEVRQNYRVLLPGLLLGLSSLLVLAFLGNVRAAVVVALKAVLVEPIDAAFQVSVFPRAAVAVFSDVIALCSLLNALSWAL